MVVSDVKKAVSQALLEDERTSDFSIDVVDDEGVVTLTGEVDTVEAKEAAGEIAEEQEGVTEVINDLAVMEEEESAEPPDLAMPKSPQR